jgi:branched-chain amino acid transport system ATP-binding protein
VRQLCRFAVEGGEAVDVAGDVRDEPSLGLAPRFVELVFDKLRELKAVGMTLLLVEQNAVKSLSISHRGYVLELGHNRFTGSGADLLGDERVRRLYLGD